MWVIPSSTASRSTATAAPRSAGGPNTCGPASCIAPYPILVRVRPSARVKVPPGSVVAAITVALLHDQGSASGSVRVFVPAPGAGLLGLRLRRSLEQGRVV